MAVTSNVNISKKQAYVFLTTLAVLTVSLVAILLKGPDPLKLQSHQTPEKVTAREFINQVVPLDGFEYVGCTFRNVTFAYNGTAPVGLIGSHIHGGIQVSTDSEIVIGAVAIMKGLGLLRSDVPFTVGLERIQPPNVMNPIRK